MKLKGKLKGANSSKLATQMGIMITVVSVCIFSLLTITSVVSARSMAVQGVSGEMSKTAENNAGQIQRMLTNAERLCKTILDYHDVKYNESMFLGGGY